MRVRHIRLIGPLLLACVMLAASPAAFGQQPNKPFRFVGNDKIPPIISMQDGKPTGLAVDLAYAVARKAHLPIRVEAMDWSQAQSLVSAGKADALLQINPTPEREKLYDFSDTLLESNFHIFRKDTHVDIQGLSSLYGKRVGVERSGFPIQFLKKYSRIHAVIIPNWKVGFEMLNREHLDAILVDRWVGEYELYLNRIGGVTVVEPPVSTAYSRIAVRKGNSQLLARINFGLKEIDRDGTRQRILGKWQPKEVVYITRESVDRLVLWVVFGFMAMLIAVALRAITHFRAIKKLNHELAKKNEMLVNASENLEEKVSERTAEIRLANTTLQMEVIERSQVEEALESTLTRFYTVLSGMYSAVLLVTDDDHVEFANQAFCDMYGLDDLPTDLVGLTAQQMIDKIRPVYVNPDEAMARIKDLVNQGQPVSGEEISFTNGKTCIRDYIPLSLKGESHGRLWQHVDITERKRAEEALRLVNAELEQRVAVRTAALVEAGEKVQAERQRFFDVLETLPAMICLLTTDRHVAFANRSFRESFGESNGRHCYEYCFGLSEPCEFCESYRPLETNEPHHWEVQAPGGRIISAHDYPFTDVDGTQMILEMDVDITEQRNNEIALRDLNENLERKVADRTKELRESEEKFSLAFANNPAAIALTRLEDGLFVDVNDTWVALNGWSRDEVIGKSARQIGIWPTHESAARFVEELKRNGFVRGWEQEFQKKSGERFIAVLSAQTIAVRGEQMILSTFVDITERKQAEEALAESKAEAELRAAEMQSFVSNLADGVSMIDADGRILWMNDAGREILRLPPDEDFADWASRYQVFALDGAPLLPEQRMVYRALHGERITDFRYKMVTPFGETIVLSVSASPVLDSQGRVIGVTSTFRDQSQRVAFEDEKQSMLDRERNIAEVLQHAIIPQEIPAEMMGYGFATKYRPALKEAEVGGDFYDIFDLGDNKIGVLIGDVAGKGLAAAIRVASARHAIRSYAYIDPRPARVMTLANESLCRDGGDESQILTAFFAVLDPEVGAFTYSSAGHEPPTVSCSGNDCEDLEAGGLPLGLVSGLEYKQSSRRLDPGDIVVAVTDGITEARTTENELYGKERLLDFVKQSRNASLDDIAAGLLAAATEHAGGQLQDDAAVVVFSPQLRRTNT